MCRSLTLIIACLCALQVSAKSSSTQSEVDFSIIERAVELSRYLSSSQRIQLIKIEEAIQRAEQKIRSGEYMQSRKPSSLNPDEDLKETHQRGKELIEEAQAERLSNQVRLVELLQIAEQQRLAQTKIIAQSYQIAALDSMEYGTALQHAAEKVLKASWEAGYQHILYNGVHLVREGKSQPASTQINNQSYDILVALDGTRFTLSMPINLSYQLTSAESSGFTYENASAFDGSKTALLAIEQIESSKSGDAVLAVRAIDIENFQLVSGQLVALKLSDSVSEAPTKQLTGHISDDKNLLRTLAELETPYQFGWDLSSLTEPNSGLLYSLLLQQTIQQNSGLQILETEFIQRTYLQNSGVTTAIQQPSAVFQLEPVEAAEISSERYTLSARLTSNNREIIIGTADFKPESAN